MGISRNGWNKKYIVNYTVLFVLLFFGVFIQIFLQGKNLIWKTDGATQYYPYLYYMGNYLRDILESLLKGELMVKMYDFAIGMGDDINSIVRFHPLDFFSVLVPGKYTETLYVLLVFLRMYLAGLSFSAFCFFWKKERNFILAGSMIYVFSGYVFIYALRHPTFHSPMIILPLLLVGAEQVMRRQNGLLFTFMTALGFISNYYFMYMCSIAMAVYVLLRFFDLYREKRTKNFFLMGIRLVLYYVLGIGMISVVLLPTVIRLLSSLRLGEKELGSMLVYDPVNRYYNWFMNMIAPYKDTGHSTSLNYAVIVLPALVLLFVRKWKEHLTVKIALLLQVAGILVPFCGFMFSGFSNISNRWIFIFSFTVSVACVWVFGEFPRMTRKQILVLVLVLIVYVSMAMGWIAGVKGNQYWKFGAIELAVCVGAVLTGHFLNITEKQWSGVLLTLVSVSCIVNGYITYNGTYGNVGEEYLEKGAGLNFYADSDFKRYQNIVDDGFYRIDSDLVTSGKENASILLGYPGVSMYNSIVHSGLIEYLLDQENPGANAVHRVFSLDGRAASEALANVKYYMAVENEEGEVPYGFKYKEELSDGIYKIYENQYPLSVGYSYDKIISKNDYNSLSALEKQQVMMEAVVLDGEAQQNISLKTISRGKDEILVVPLELPAKGDNVKATKNGYDVGKGGGTLKVTYEKKEGYEAYLRFMGFYKDTSYTRVDIKTSNVDKHIMLRGHGTTYTLGREDYLVNLGVCHEDGTEEITITLRDKNKYELDGMEICYVSLDQHISNLEALNKVSLQNVSEGTNSLSGTVTLEEERFMVFSVPYSEGWTAYVDGEKSELQKANIMYMGLLLEPGEHEIVLRYCTPGIKAGFTISLISMGVFLMLFVIWAKKVKVKTKFAVQ